VTNAYHKTAKHLPVTLQGQSRRCAGNRVACGSVCCDRFEACVAGVCGARCRGNASPCGLNCCNPGIVCCGNVCCPFGQSCRNGTCVTTVACNPPFVIRGSDGKCVFPTTPGICPRNEVDCAKGCATLGTATDPATVCQGGTCENGVCISHTLTASELATLRTSIQNFVTSQNQAEAATVAAGTASDLRVGDFIGACTRLMFHDPGPGRSARGCNFVRDQATASCNGRPCEFTAPHNNGMQQAVQTIHDFYNDQAFWPRISLVDFIYLFGAEALRVVSSGNANIPFRTGRVPCQCLRIRPLSACASLPSFSDATMPAAENTFAQLQNIMQTQMGFTENEWLCLLGAHALGRTKRTNSGYGGPWTSTSSTFSNQYYHTMNEDLWVVENGAVSTNEDIPIVGNKEFRVPGTNHMMLRADMCPYWDIESNPTCQVDHGATASGCPRRLPQFDFLQTLLDVNVFFNCFNPAFQKMSEMGTSGLHTPS